MLTLRKDGSALIQVGVDEFIEAESCNRCGELVPVDEFLGSECRACAAMKWGA